MKFLKNKKSKKVGVGLGIVFGTGLGIVFGSIFNEIAWGIIIGTCAGVTLGSIYDLQNNNNDGTENNKTNK